MASTRPKRHDPPQPIVSNTHPASDTEQPAGSMTKYSMYYTPSRLNVSLHESRSPTPAKYYVQSKISFIDKPKLLMRKGDAKISPVVAFSVISAMPHHLEIGKGNFLQGSEDQVVRQYLLREKGLTHRSDYRLGISTDPEAAKIVELRWRKDMEKVARTAYDCVNEDGKVMAKMLSGGAFNWKKGGEVEVAENLDQGLKETLIISAMAIWALEAMALQSLLKGF